MEAVPGGTYRVRVRLSSAESLHPAWLVAALGATYPNAELLGLRKAGKNHVDLDVRWRRRAGAIETGDTLVPMTEGLSVPGLPLPSATVDAVQPLRLPPTDPLVADVPAPYQLAGKLTLSAALLLFVAWRSSKIKS